MSDSEILEILKGSLVAEMGKNVESLPRNQVPCPLVKTRNVPGDGTRALDGKASLSHFLAAERLHQND
jgi:hypothetical protein